MGHGLWGTTAPRRFFGDAHWREPLKWNEEAGRAGTRERVFCASMADVFEWRSDLNEQRARLWELIRTPLILIGCSSPSVHKTSKDLSPGAKD